MHATLARKLLVLRRTLGRLDSLAVAFSGGVDSTLLLRVAVEQLGDRAVAVTGVSASLAAGERASARDLAALVGARFVELRTAELDDPRYVRNAPDRCYFCKSELFDRVLAWAADAGFAHVADGLNADDDPAERPGVRAATERDVLSPLRDAGLTKLEIRALSRHFELPTAEKPASPCLASRIPHGTAVTPARLRRVERAEAALRALGFAELRVRHHFDPAPVGTARLDTARIEVPLGDVERLLALRAAVVDALGAAGFERVVVDLDGLRSGGADRPGRLLEVHTTVGSSS